MITVNDDGVLGTLTICKALVRGCSDVLDKRLDQIEASMVESCRFEAQGPKAA